jgi:hypothetical protein
MENLFDLSKLDSRLRGYFVDYEGKVYSNKQGVFREMIASRNGSNKYWNFSNNGCKHSIRADRLVRGLNHNHEYRSFASAAKALGVTAPAEAMNKGFIVGSISPQGVSFSNRPKVHTTEASARAECERLAILFTHKTFMYVEIKGSVKASGVNWS